jgi:polyisoprenoid-binding protein YceI
VHAADIAQPLPEATVRYLIDKRGSTFTVRAFSEGFLAAFGHSPAIAIRDFTGEAQLIPGDRGFEGASLRLRIRAESLEVTNDVSDKDRKEIHRRMFEEVLETAAYPEIFYQCDRASASGSPDGRYWVALNGELTLHGVTRPFPVSARVTVTGEMLRAAGEFSLLLSDFDIERPTVAAGAVRIKDEIKASFDIVARKPA